MPWWLFQHQLISIAEFFKSLILCLNSIDNIITRYTVFRKDVFVNLFKFLYQENRNETKKISLHAKLHSTFTKRNDVNVLPLLFLLQRFCRDVVSLVSTTHCMY